MNEQYYLKLNHYTDQYGDGGAIFYYFTIYNQLKSKKWESEHFTKDWFYNLSDKTLYINLFNEIVDNCETYNLKNNLNKINKNKQNFLLWV